MTLSKKYNSWERCLCDNEYCNEVSNKILNYFHPDHPWVGKFTFERNSTLKHDVFFAVVKKELNPFTDVDTVGSRLHIAKHHFPISLHDFQKNKNKRITTFLTKYEAAKIFNNDGVCMQQQCYLVSNIIGETNMIYNVNEEFYVQAPFESFENVINILHEKMIVYDYGEDFVEDIEDNNNDDDVVLEETAAYISSFEFPTISVLEQIIRYEWKTKKGVLYFERNANVLQSILLLRSYHKHFDLILLENGSYFGVCPKTGKEENCYEYYITERKRKKSSDAKGLVPYLCPNCKEEHYSKKRSEAQISQSDTANRIATASSVPFAKLNQNELLQRLRKVRDTKNIKKRGME